MAKKKQVMKKFYKNKRLLIEVNEKGEIFVTHSYNNGDWMTYIKVEDAETGLSITAEGASIIRTSVAGKKVFVYNPSPL